MKDDKLFIDKDEPILLALKKMDQEKTKLLIVGSKNKFEGLISIGDLQRAIINNISLSTPIFNILRKNIIVAREYERKEDIMKKMFHIRAEFMPVVNNKNEIIKVYFWKDVFQDKAPMPRKQFDLPVIIMAGGLGSRLKPLTNVLPKALIPIGEKTILELIFEHFAKHGCNNFYLSVNYKAELIEFYLRNQHLPYHIHFFKEDKPMGTAGSLSLLKDNIDRTFFVSNCDILIEQDYSEILDYHREQKNEITIVAALKHYPIPYGTVETTEKGQLVDLHEKPELTFKINSGMYILEPHLLKQIPENQFFHITHLIEKVHKDKGRIGVFPVSQGAWKDIGEWPEYLNQINHQL